MRAVLRGLGPLALGLALALGQAPWGLPWVSLAALVLAFAWLPLRFAPGWLLGLGHFGLAMHWIVEPFLVEPDRHGWIAPFALVLMAGGLALFWGAAFGLAGRWRLGRLGLVALWAGAEAARSFVLTGLPWALIGHVWIDTGLGQVAAWIGPQGLTLLTLAVAASLAQVAARRWAGLWPVLLLPVMLALAPGPAVPPDPAAPLVRIVQPNIPQDEKWDPALVEVHLRRLLELTRTAGEGEHPRRPDLVLWPETAVPHLLEWAEPVLAAAADAAGGAPIALGITRREGESRYFNALVLLQGGPAPLAVHDKAHLTPFGEYMPLGEVFARFGIHGLASSEGGGFTAGPGLRHIEVPGLGPVLPLICYEGVFAEEVNGAAAGARALMLATNDAWFGTFAGPQQHLVQARFRAIEQGMPLIRAANTGISAMIDAQGRVLARLDLDQTGALDATLPPAGPPTAYARWGDVPFSVAVLALLALALWRRRAAH